MKKCRIIQFFALFLAVVMFISTPIEILAAEIADTEVVYGEDTEDTENSDTEDVLEEVSTEAEATEVEIIETEVVGEVEEQESSVIIIEENFKKDSTTSGTLGSNNGFEWTYDVSTKTLSVTGKDTGLKIKDGFNVEEIENVVFSECEFVNKMSHLLEGCTNLKTVEFINCDTSTVVYMSGVFKGCSSLTSIDLSGLDTSKVAYMDDMFNGCTSLTSLDLSNFNTSKANYMDGMFKDCSSLTSIDVSGFDTSRVATMDDMFSGCSSLTNINVSGFDTSNVDSMGYMFRGCSSLTNIDVSGFDTSNAMDLTGMFASCTTLTNLDLSGFDTSRVSIMTSMFANCTGLTNIDVSGFDTSNVEWMGSMFSKCTNLTSVDVSNFDTSRVRYMTSMFAGCTSLTNLDLSGFDTSNVTSMANMFAGCTSLTNLDLSGFDTSNVTDMNSMFKGCNSVTNLNISSLDVSNVKYMSSMFGNCTSLKTLDANGWDASSVKDMSNMFNGCTALTSLDVSGWDTSSVEDMSNMFENCSSLTGLDASSWNTSNVTNMGNMFKGCTSLTNVNVSSFDTSNVVYMQNMFSNCKGLININLSNFSTPKVRDMSSMFYSCTYLENLNISNFEINNLVLGVNEADSMLTYCASLTVIHTPKKINSSSYIALPTRFYDENDNSISIIYDDDCGKVLTKVKGMRYYTIAYVLNGGINNESNPTDYSNLSDTIELLEPTREGYTFGGWYSDSEFTEKVSEITSGSNGDKTFYAKWTINKYTIKFEGNGATTGTMTALANCVFDKSYTLTSNGFKKRGYKFLGWNTVADGSGTTYMNQEQVKNLSRENGVIITLYAQWERLEYTITYIDGGSHQNPITYNVDTGVIILTEPSREGHTFEGWYSDAKYKTKVTQIKQGTIGDKTFYAKWTPNTYKITFNANGGTGKMSDIAMIHDKVVILTNNDFKKNGYEFVRWTTEKDGTGTAYMNMEEVVNLATSGTITLYAQWKPIEYSITYVLNADGDESVVNPNASKTTYDATMEAYNLQNPTRPNYTFGGWYSDAKFKTKVTQIKTGSSGDKTLYAKWTINKYTVKFDKNGGTGTTMKDLANCAYDKDYTLTKVGYKKTGYTFVGWNTQANGEGKAYANQAVVDGLELLGAESTNGTVVTLYAQWEIDTYDIAFNGIDGADNTVNNDTPATYTVEDETITLKAPSKEGYTFKGWYTDAKFKNAVSYNKTTGVYTAVKKGSTGDKTFYAKWAANAYKIVFDKNDAAATGSMSNLSATYDKNVTLTKVGYKKKGYEFTGWNTEANGSGTAYANNVSVKNLAVSGTATLYAQWAEGNYDITYIAGEHANNPNADTNSYSYGQTVNLKAPTREGYIFKGWYTDAKFTKALKKDATTGEYIAIKATDEGDKTFYAKWQAEGLKYSIVFSKGGDNAITQADYTQAGVKVGTATALTENKFTKTGYTFKGWATEEDGEVVYTNKQKVTDISTTEEGEIQDTVTLYPVFEKTEYKITYSNGGTHSNPLTYFVDSEDVELANPEKAGYKFGGWYTNKNLKEAYRIETLELEGKTGNKTVYAKWTANKYTVSFDANTEGLYGAVTGTMADQSMTYDKQAALKANGFKLTGYKFTGWNTEADGTGTAYADKAKVQNLVTEGSVTLYAQWEKTAYKITYKLNGGTNNAYNKATYTVTDMIYLNKPTKDGYTFGGWYTDANFKKSVSAPAIEQGTTGNKTYYAKWTVNKYNIVFNANCPEDEVQATGSMANVNNCQYGKNYTLKANAYKRTGYTFTGWNTEADGSGTAVKNQASVKNLGAKLESENGETVTLYAQWTRNVYTITYKLNGGINSPENPATYTIENGVITLEDPTMDDYVFKGWYADAKGKTEVESIDASGLKNVTLYAMWKKAN